jgi:hypothetical protein
MNLLWDGASERNFHSELSLNRGGLCFLRLIFRLKTLGFNAISIGKTLVKGQKTALVQAG